MICVAENNSGVDVLSEFAGVDSLDASDCADRHEDRCRYLAVVGGYFSGTGVA